MTTTHSLAIALDMAESLIDSLETTGCPPQAFAPIRRAVVLAVTSKLASAYPNAIKRHCISDCLSELAKRKESLADVASIAALDTYCGFQSESKPGEVLQVLQAIITWQP